MKYFGKIGAHKVLVYIVGNFIVTIVSILSFLFWILTLGSFKGWVFTIAVNNWLEEKGLLPK